MASEKLQRILEMSKNMDKKGGESKRSTPAPRQIKREVPLSERLNNADKAIANIDAMYNAPYVPSQEEIDAWNPERGREQLAEMADKNKFLDKLSKSKLPAAIIESMRNNPCNYDESTFNSIMGPENTLFKKLNETFGKGKEEPVRGVKAIQQINEQLKTRDKQVLEETRTLPNANSEQTNVEGINLEMLEQVIERVIDRKLGMINESINRAPQSTIRSMALTESGSFKFLDTEGNVYECTMKYLGKRKAKK